MSSTNVSLPLPSGDAAAIPAVVAFRPARTELPWLATLLVISVGLHALAVAGIGHGGSSRPIKAKAPTLMTMEVAPPKPAPPPSVAAPTPRPAAHKLAVARAPRASAATPAAAPPPQAETPADFSGTTLTNDGPGQGWASATGDGQALHGPIGTPGARVTGRSQAGVSDGVPHADGPPTVKLGDLSSPPRAPALNLALERNYPEDARKRGLQGTAVLRARILPDGHVRDLVMVSQSAPGFGDACKRTLRDSIWSPPLDRDARPVSTFVSYTCTFEVH